MAVEYDPNGTPILTNDSLISDVPPYTQALAATGVGGGGGSCTVKDSKFNDLQPADPISPFPIGMLAPFMGENAPDGWLLCDGRSYDAAYFYALAEANPDFHNDGTFRVPDLRGRSPIGAGGEGVAREWTLGERWGEQQPGRHTHSIKATSNHLDPRVVFVKGGGAGVTGNWVGTDYAGALTQTEDGTAMAAAPTTGWTDSEYWMGNSKNYQPSTGVNFIVYSGRPTLDINGDILPECGQGTEIVPVTTRMMIEQRLAEAGIGEEEVKMLKEQLEEIKKTEAK